MFKKGIVEIDVMGDENGSLEPFVYKRGYFVEIRGIGDHFIGDAGQYLDESGNGHTRVDQSLIALQLPDSIVEHNSHFRYGVISCITTGSFYVDYRVHFSKDLKVRLIQPPKGTGKIGYPPTPYLYENV